MDRLQKLIALSAAIVLSIPTEEVVEISAHSLAEMITITYRIFFGVSRRPKKRYNRGFLIRKQLRFRQRVSCFLIKNPEMVGIACRQHPM